MKKIYSLLALFILVLTASAQSTVSIDITANGFGVSGKTEANPSFTVTANGVSMTVNKGTSGFASYLSQDQFRFYKGATLSIEVASATITSVKFYSKASDAKYSVKNITQGGTALTANTDGTEATWTGSVANSVEFANTAQVRPSKIEVTFTPSGTAVAMPTFSLAAGTYNEAKTVTISGTGTIYYTLNGVAPTGLASELYSAPVQLSADGTYHLQAIAVAGDGTKSLVAVADYVIDLPGVNDVIYENALTTKDDFNGFTYAVASQDSVFDVWTAQTYGAKASGYASKKKHATDATLTSPVIDLSGKKNVKLSFEDYGNYFEDATKFSEHAKVMVREENGTWEELTLPNRATGTVGAFVNTGEADLSKFDGKKIEVQFHYTSTTDLAGTWEIKNFRVTGDDDNATGISALEPIKKADEAIFDLSGRRVSKAVRGVYIINGKKTFVK